MIRLLASCSRGVSWLAVFSVVIALLQFVVPLYMMAVYNRILQTRSIETLQMISIIAVALLLVMAVAEIARSRLLAMMGRRISEYLNRDVYMAILATPGSRLARAIGADPQAPRTEAFNDLRTVVAFVTSGTLNTFFDAVLAPLFLLALFILHPVIGMLGAGAAVIIFSLAVISELIVRRGTEEVNRAEGRAQGTMERSLRQFDAVTAMGMGPTLFARWQEDRTEGAELSARQQSWVGLMQGIAKGVRLTVQLAVLGVGAWLVVTTDEFLAGAIIAASIIMGRALAPIDSSIAQWRVFAGARISAKRLVKVMKAVDQEPVPFDLPEPQAAVVIRSLNLGFEGQPMNLIQGVNLVLQGGQSLAVFGPNGAGKTTFLRALTGLIPPRNGEILLGATAVDRFSEGDRHRFFGYLPQDVQLLPGTVGENITRFRGTEEDRAALFAAVEAAGALEIIQQLPGGFDTPLTEHSLSSGQTQLLGLARAVYGDPLLLVMDEPTANLDPAGIASVMRLIQARAERGRITVFSSHAEPLLQRATHMMMVVPGKVSVGPTKEMIQRLMAGKGKAA